MRSSTSKPLHNSFAGMGHTRSALDDVAAKTRSSEVTPLAPDRSFHYRWPPLAQYPADKPDNSSDNLRSHPPCRRSSPAF